MSTSATPENDDRASVVTQLSRGLSANSKDSRLRTFLDAIRRVSALQSGEDVFRELVNSTCQLLRCDRVTIFKHDHIRNELVLLQAEGATNIRVKVTKDSICGYCCSEKETINVPDAYKDARFNSGFDKKTGYKTTTILCAPIYDSSDNVVGVIQAINKKRGKFNKSDQVYLENFAVHTGVALSNAAMYEKARNAEKKMMLLIEMVKMLHSDPAINSLVFTISNRAHKIVDADRCTLYLIDHPKKQLCVMQGNVDFRFPWDKGIAGAVATTGKTLNIEDAYEDERFNKAMDAKTGYRTRQILCLPITNSKGQTIGVFQCINKVDQTPSFTELDEDILTTVLSLAGPLLESSSFFKVKEGQASEAEKMQSLKVSKKSPRKSPLGGLGGISE